MVLEALRLILEANVIEGWGTDGWIQLAEIMQEDGWVTFCAGARVGWAWGGMRLRTGAAASACGATEGHADAAGGDADAAGHD